MTNTQHEYETADTIAPTGFAKVSELVDGDVFCLGDDYFDIRWHTAAVVLFGSVACYVKPNSRRTSRSMTYRVDAAEDQIVGIL